MEYEGTKRDELIGGTEYPLRMVNVSVAAGAQVKRGQILAGVGGLYAPATDSDASKDLVIAAAPCQSSDVTVTAAYSSGLFNRERLSPSDTAVFESELRRQNIHLTSIKEVE